MASRRWVDWDILAKMGAGLVMMGITAACVFIGGFITMRVFVLGGLGVVVFLWGLLSIGDTKNEWE